MKMFLVYFLTPQLFLWGPFSYGFESHCQLKGKQILEKADEILETVRKNGVGYPETTVLNLDLDALISESRDNTSGMLEAFYRPQVTKSFSLPLIPLFSVKLERDRHLIYICAQKSNLELDVQVYFLGSKHLDSISLEEEAVDESPKISPFRLTPLTLSIQNIAESVTGGGNSHGFSPFRILLLPITLTTAANEWLLRAFSELSGIEIEGIRITERSIEVTGGVNLEKPEHPRFSKLIPFDSLEATILDRIRVHN